MKKNANFYFILTLIIAVALAGCGGGGGKKPEQVTNYYLYVASDESNTVSAFLIDPTNGALTGIPGSSVSTDGPTAIAADPSGKFLYVANNSNKIAIFSINAATGVLTQITDSSTENNPEIVTIDPTGNFVAVGCSHYLYIFKRDQNNGTLSERASFIFNGQELTAVSFDRTGQTLYVGVSTGYIYVYAKNSGSNTFTEVGGPYTTIVSSSSMAFNPTGDYLFVSTSGSSSIGIHPVNGDGSLGAYTLQNLLAPSHSFIIDDNYLYAAKSTGISVYSIANIASLPEIETINRTNFDTDPDKLVFDPTKKFIYATGWSSNYVWGFVRNPADGKLTEISGNPLDNGAEISSIVTVKTLY
jgi:6-phosphogluconolactonase (cycloisomerase 2 family)